MKKTTTILSLILFLSINLMAQEQKRTKIFKYHPFSLITGSFNLSQEIFNKENTKSTVIGLGIRYVNKESDNNYYGSSTTYEQFNKWQGASVWVDRRFYVPAFQSGEKYGFNNEKVKFGVYLAPGLKLDYNYNNYDNGYYSMNYNQAGQAIDPVLYINNGKTSYLSAFPNVNIGMQFTLFQNMYIDTFIGGGVKFISKNIIADNSPQGGNYGYSYVTTDAIETFVIREGVRPNFGFSLGINL
ncbi:MAG: hypothetical protein IPP61_18735 [Cytophagaceae bacterium]|nr:hypothetical protein [Cytophagaceae bacterium]MBK9936479.1 hypothetical protein [Cytophagaceae bacterium]MBL0300229.1 hypothetical protein [Cytophagaceae bacterium]MBL0327166.1 hypothetical protein [Cytophagaceae bacterium]